jgi:hypothetical protein
MLCNVAGDGQSGGGASVHLVSGGRQWLLLYYDSDLRTRREIRNDMNMRTKQTNKKTNQSRDIPTRNKQTNQETDKQTQTNKLNKPRSRQTRGQTKQTNKTRN